MAGKLKKKKLVKCKYCANYKKLEDWCHQITDSPYEDMERECEHYVPRLNLQEIREMKAEDIAPLLISNYFDNDGFVGYKTVDGRVFGTYSEAHARVLVWLYSTVETE